MSSCLSHIFLILTGVSRDERKITTMRKHLTISLGARRNRYKTDKIAFFNFKNIHFSSNQRLSNASTRCLITFCGSSLRNRKLSARMSLLNRRFCIRQIVSRVMRADSIGSVGRALDWGRRVAQVQALPPVKSLCCVLEQHIIFIA